MKSLVYWITAYVLGKSPKRAAPHSTVESNRDLQNVVMLAELVQGVIRQVMQPKSFPGDLDAC